MEGLISALIEGALKGSPFIALLSALWLLERRDRVAAQKALVDYIREAGEAQKKERDDLLERTLTALMGNSTALQAVQQGMAQVTALVSKRR